MSKAFLPEIETRFIKISPKYCRDSKKLDKIFLIRKSKGREYIIEDEDIDYDLNAKIKIYKDRIKGWSLDICEKLLDDPNSSLIILMICTAYLESNQQYRDGKISKGNSGEVIKKALRRRFIVPKDHEHLLDLFFDAIRCGLFHDAMIRKNTLIKYNIPDAIMVDEVKKQIILINPKKLFEVIKLDLKEYVEDLEDNNNQELRENFEKLWDKQHDISL